MPVSAPVRPVFSAPMTQLECGCVHPVHPGKLSFYCPRHGVELVAGPAQEDAA